MEKLKKIVTGETRKGIFNIDQQFAFDHKYQPYKRVKIAKKYNFDVYVCENGVNFDHKFI